MIQEASDFLATKVNRTASESASDQRLSQCLFLAFPTTSFSVIVFPDRKARILQLHVNCPDIYQKPKDSVEVETAF
jgi:hypothetical protein